MSQTIHQPLLPARWVEHALDSFAALMEIMEAVALRTVLAMLSTAGPVAASNAMGRLFRAFGPMLPVTRVADRNLRLTMPQLDEASRRRILRDMWESLGRTAGEFAHLADLRQCGGNGPGWTMENAHILTAQATRGGPAIFVSGHIGNWEMLPVAVAAYGMPFASVYRPASHRRVNDIILALRRRAIGRDIPTFAKGAQGARQALEHLRQGGFLGMLIDQKMNDGVEATLFGLPAMTAPAAAALALRFRCPIIPGHVIRTGPARFRLVAEEPLHLPDTGDRQADIEILTQALNDRLEYWVRQQPHSWLWLHRRFPKDLYRRATIAQQRSRRAV